jgi:hypothetical protein
MFDYGQWEPLSVGEVVRLLRDAPFAWALAGGYAVEQFLGGTIRTHADIDIVVYRDDQRQLREWLGDWCLYAAEPPGTLRGWEAAVWLAAGIHDIWGYRAGAQAWELQIMLVETEGDQWFSRHNSLIRGQRSDLMVNYQQIPCVRIEVQLLYKARSDREKDRRDFQACLSLLSPVARQWLKDALHLAYPHGHPWLDVL